MKRTITDVILALTFFLVKTISSSLLGDIIFFSSKTIF